MAIHLQPHGVFFLYINKVMQKHCSIILLGTINEKQQKLQL